MSRFNVDFCCACLKICKEKDKLVSLGLERSRGVTYRNKLKSCVPEMILQNTEDCFLCLPCSNALESAYSFRCMCLITEKKLQEHRSFQQRNFKDVCSVREDLLQVLSKELKDLEIENPAIIAAKELDNLLTETLVKQESHSTLESIKIEVDSIAFSNKKLSDNDLIRKACKVIPELKNIPEKALKCQVRLEKISINKLPVIIPSTDADNRKNSSLYCGICDVVLKKKERFYSHMLKHSNIKGYKCDMCTAAYFSADSLRYHRKRMHTGIPEVGTNKGVKSLPKTTIPTIQDKKKVDLKKKKAAVEEKCILKIKLPQKIKKVAVSKSSLKDKVFQCNYCEYNTTSKPLYDRHTIKHGAGGSYQCALCPKTYFEQCELNRHIRNIHKINDKPPVKKKRKGKMPPPISIKEEIVEDDAICTLCSLRFSSEPELKTHLKTHIEDKQENLVKRKKKKYFCNTCNSEFSSKDHANIHTGEKPYKCLLCPKTFGAYCTLRKHRNTHTHDGRKKQDSKQKKNSVCNICQQEFECDKDLWAHNCQTSSGESVYRCQICKNAYLGRTALIKHMKVHVGQNGN